MGAFYMGFWHLDNNRGKKEPKNNKINAVGKSYNGFGRMGYNGK